jgi:hypothetical protein
VTSAAQRFRQLSRGQPDVLSMLGSAPQEPTLSTGASSGNPLILRLTQPEAHEDSRDGDGND